jgi:hypothetical protein
MRRLGIAAVLFLFAASIAMAQTSQPSNDQQSTSDKTKGAVSGAAGTVQSGAETGYDKTKEGAEKAYGSAKDAATGSSSDQTGGQEQTGGQAQTGTEGTSTKAGKKLPQTASPLPLLGLLGLGIFSFGTLSTRWFRR